MMLGFHERQGKTQSGSIFDRFTWLRAYNQGYREPRFPVPATMMHSAVANFHNREWSWKWAVEWTKARMKF